MLINISPSPLLDSYHEDLLRSPRSNFDPVSTTLTLLSRNGIKNTPPNRQVFPFEIALQLLRHTKITPRSLGHMYRFELKTDKNFRHGNGEKWLLGGSVGGLAGGSMIVGLALVCWRYFGCTGPSAFDPTRKS